MRYLTKVMDAENKKAECGREHHRRATLFHDAEKRLVQLEEKHRRAIIKARPYFEIRAQCDQMLETQKERVKYLQQTVKETKRNYATSLRTLEEISNQIHQQRRDYDIVANGPREPGVGAELIGSDMCQKFENRNNDSCKISPIRYNESGNNEKLHDIEKFCTTKEDAEHLDKRSVDGSESKFTQWELELQASMEKLNRLSVEKSSYVKERGSAQSSSDFRDAVEIGTANGTCYNLLPAEQSNARSLNQFSRSTVEDLESFVGRSSKNTSIVVSKSNISKSLNNSPVNRNTSTFEDRIIRKTKSVDIFKYVPNQISQFDVKSEKEKSSSNINISSIDVDTTSEEQRRNNTNDTLVSKSHVQLTNLPTTQASNTKFLPAESSLSKGHYSAATSGVNQHRVGSQSDVTLSQTRSSFNILQKSASCSANSSPRRLKNLLRSTAKSTESESTERLDERFNLKKLVIKTTSIKELPLLSIFGSTSALSANRGKSCSMIDLNGKQNLKTLLDNSRLGNIQAVSAEKLANVRYKLVNDYPETKTDDIKK